MEIVQMWTCLVVYNWCTILPKVCFLKLSPHKLQSILWQSAGSQFSMVCFVSLINASHFSFTRHPVQNMGNSVVSLSMSLADPYQSGLEGDSIWWGEGFEKYTCKHTQLCNLKPHIIQSNWFLRYLSNKSVVF